MPLKRFPTTYSAILLRGASASASNFRFARSLGNMKLIVAIVQDYDCDRLLNEATSKGFRATRIASTGGFLRAGNTTVLLGVADADVATAVQIVAQTCTSRPAPSADTSDVVEWYPSGIDRVEIGGGIVFILRVERFERMRVTG
jgi:uncharacterized protein YaaQ